MTCNKFQCPECFSFKRIILSHVLPKMVVILELHRLEAAKRLSLQLFIVIAMLLFFLLQLNFHLHMIQNRIRVMSPAVHLQFYCCFCSFHFSCAISTQTLPCLKCRSFDRSICIRPFPVSFKRSQPAFVFGIKFTLPIVNAVSPLTFSIHLRHNKQDQS